MKIQAISDMHGKLPEGVDCDLLLIAGDICPAYNHKLFFQDMWFRSDFMDWLDRQKFGEAVLVAGNHDWIFQHFPNGYNALCKAHRCTYLEDASMEYESLLVYGTPWQPTFFDWAFNASEEFLAKKWLTIPEGCDILVLHGPPRGFGDFSDYGAEHTGSPSLTDRIREIAPRLVVCGHIHNAVGHYQIIAHNEEIVDVYNVSCVDTKYELRSNPITTIEI